MYCLYIDTHFKSLVLVLFKNDLIVSKIEIDSGKHSQYMIDSLKKILEESQININHVEGIKIVPYIYHMEEVMNVADVIIGRAGAMTVTEISNLGKPSILIPLPNVSHNHQLYNAKVLESIEAAKIILNDELTGEKLEQMIEEIILDKSKMQKMGENALKVSASQAEDKIYQEIKKLIK